MADPASTRAVIALQLIRRWRNLRYDHRHPRLRRPPSILLAKYVAHHANQTRGLADELIHQVESMIAIFEAADGPGRLVFERNPACRDDILTDRWPGSLVDQRIFLGELRDFAANGIQMRRHFQAIR